MVIHNTNIQMSCIEYPNMLNHITDASVPWKEGSYEQEYDVWRHQKSPLPLLSSVQTSCDQLNITQSRQLLKSTLSRLHCEDNIGYLLSKSSVRHKS